MWLRSLLFMVLAVVALPLSAGEADIRVGVLAFQGSERAMRDWEPTIAHLNAAIPDHRFVAMPLDPDAIVAAVAERRIDFVITNPGNYVELEAATGASRLATREAERSGSPTAAIGSTVIARAARADINDLSDLRGRGLAIVSSEAFGGFQVIWRELADLGIHPDSDLRDLRRSGFPMERVVWMVRDGAADAGVLRACLLEDLIAEGRVDAAEFKVVGSRQGPDFPCQLSSRLYPDWPFVKLAHAPHALAKRVVAALLSMPAVEGEAWTAPLDYTQVHALMRELRIGPYSQLPPLSLGAMVREHWRWMVAALVAVLWWVVHVARVEVLVRRRTAELEREMAERGRAEREAERHREERDQFSRLGILGEMASNIAHELNQPLAAIMNYTRGMTRMLEAGNADPAMLLDGARGAAGQAERAAAIIERIRGFVRRRSPRRECLDLDDVVADTLVLFGGLAARRGIAIHVHLDHTLPPVVADRVEIQQVLFNLLQNAVDAMAGQSGAAAGITVRTSAAGGMVKVAVRDAGTGLPPEAENRLFDPFFTTKPEGLGLGLSICRTIVESHGGHLWAAANPDRGLTLRFTLPAAEVRA